MDRRFRHRRPPQAAAAAPAVGPTAAGTLVTRGTTGVDAVDVGFQPVALVFTLSSRIALATSTISDDVAFAVGFTDGTTTRCSAVRDQDNVGTTATGRAWTADISLVNTSGGFSEAVGTITLTATGFEINWTTKTNTHVLGYLAIGGANVSAKVLTFSRAGTGDSVVTGAGFQPKGGFFLASGRTALGGANDEALYAFGFADDDTDETSLSYAAQNAAAAADTAFGLLNLAYGLRSPGSASYLSGTLTSWDADGFTANFTVEAITGTQLCAALVLGGTGISAIEMVDIVADTSTGAHTQTVSGLPFQPDAGVILGASTTTATASTTARSSVGMFAADLGQSGLAAQSVDAADPTNTSEAALGSALVAYNSTADANLDAVGTITAVGATSIDVEWGAGKTADAFLWRALLINYA